MGPHGGLSLQGSWSAFPLTEYGIRNAISHVVSVMLCIYVFVVDRFCWILFVIKFSRKLVCKVLLCNLKRFLLRCLWDQWLMKMEIGS